MLADPVAVCELQKQHAVETACCPVIDILHRGEMTQLGGPGTRLEAFLLAQCHLVLEQNTEPLHVVESLAFRVGCQIAQALGHAVQAELAQSINRGMLQQRRSPQ